MWYISNKDIHLPGIPNKVCISLWCTLRETSFIQNMHYKCTARLLCLARHWPAKVRETRNWPSRNLESSDPDFNPRLLTFTRKPFCKLRCIIGWGWLKLALSWQHLGYGTPIMCKTGLMALVMSPYHRGLSQSQYQVKSGKLAQSLWT